MPLDARSLRAISSFAAGATEMRESALVAHRLGISEHPKTYVGTTYHKFMCEVEAPVADYALRARFRQDVISEAIFS